jgi:lipoic acid synthetase
MESGHATGESSSNREKRSRKPPWLRIHKPSGGPFFKLRRDLEKKNLHTICQSARCPNMGECWNQGSATILILGDTCTRDCLFCAVPGGIPAPVDPDEPARILEMATMMKLKYIVITSVTRDDLADGGSGHFHAVITTLKQHLPSLGIEVLIPDFSGRPDDLDRVIDAGPDVLNHNLETVRSLYRRINRPPANYDVSLAVLKHAKGRGCITKSGIMVGLGETESEIETTLEDLRKSGVDLLTVGQYLQPAHPNLKVRKYYTPAEFGRIKRTALARGFKEVESGPLVRSSYRADSMYRRTAEKTRDLETVAP